MAIASEQMFTHSELQLSEEQGNVTPKAHKRQPPRTPRTPRGMQFRKSKKIDKEALVIENQCQESNGAPSIIGVDLRSSAAAV
jgi:hypothetical protein